MPLRPWLKTIYQTISTESPAPAAVSAPDAADTPKPAGLFPSGCPAASNGARPVLPLPGITFKFGLAQLEPEAIPVVRNLAKTLSENLPNATFTIEGHTDSSGGFAYNQELSLRRAEAVRAYLVGMGVKAERLEATGAGYCGLANTDDPAGGENRRVVVINTSG